jgi:hypothetical protein
VCTALDKHGTTAVLSGGGAAMIYSEETYASRDLDFVVTFSGGKGARAMEELGFELKNSMYVHPLTPFTVEFPPGPLAIGDDYAIKHRTLRDGEMLLNIIKLADSMLDRFAAYVFWKDKGSLHSAALVARALGTELDWKRIVSWCEVEGVSDKVADLRAAMESLGGSGKP